MRVKQRLWIVPVVGLLLLTVGVLPSTADHGTRTTVGPLAPMGDSPKVVPADAMNTHLGPTGRISSDLAFWGNRAYQGNWHGFRIIDISNPSSPVEVLDYEGCGPETTGQGDIVVWDRDGNGVADLLVWARNSAANATSTCDGDLEGVGFEGIHIFDISNDADPDRIASVETDGGTHTLTAVPDTANNRLLIYSNSSSTNGIEVIEIPLNDPANPTLLRTEPAIGACHDVSVFLGDVLRTICAGGSGTSVYSNDPAEGGSLVNPRELYSFDNDRDGTGIAHSAAFTWDGEYFVIGHEPGGGSGAECSEDDREVERTLHFYDIDNGVKIGEWVIDNLQTTTENCTTHNFNFIPTLNGRDILVSGHYQAGTWIVDFTDPNNIHSIAHSDPPPLDTNALILGGAWSTYWYNGFAYESEITKGLHVFQVNTPEAAPGAFRPETSSNPQTQMESIDLGACKGSAVTLRGTGGNDTIAGTSVGDVVDGLGGKDNLSGEDANDVLCGSRGKDRAKGGPGDDVLVGGPKNDVLNGGPGRDTCIGGPGKKDKAKKCEVTRSIP